MTARDGGESGVPPGGGGRDGSGGPAHPNLAGGPGHPDLLERAIRVAARQHEGQLSKGDAQPFITHPVAVALLCARAGMSVETVAAALLHDVLEDTDMDRDALAEAVDEGVTRIVDEVTKAEGDELSWEEKARLYVKRLRTASREALGVAAADKVHNLFRLVRAYEREGPAVLSRFNSTPGERLAFYEDVRGVIAARWPDCPLLAELDRELARAREVLPE